MASRFNAPTRFTTPAGEVVFEVPIKPARKEALGFCLRAPKVGDPLQGWDSGYEVALAAHREKILKELANETALFRNPPTLKTLDAMAANWLGEAKRGVGRFVGNVDLCLHKLIISRSRIESVWETVPAAEATIDFDWAAAATGAELEEVSDVPAAGGEPFVLSDPAAKERAKVAEKAKIRDLFAAATNARLEAETAAAAFLDTYDLSDSESAFSEWMSADESGDD
jgi:hypothetical protein